MGAAALDPHTLHPPAARRDSAPAFAMAVAMHLALVLGMWVSVQWHTSASAPAVAELWDLNSNPDPTPPADVPPPAPPPPIPVAQQPTTTAPARPDADIAVRAKPAHEKTEAPEDAKAQRRKREAERKRQEREDRERQEKADRRQREELQRLASAATVGHTTAQAVAGEVSNEYGARIEAAVRSHLAYAVPEGTPSSAYADFHVELLPTGELAADPTLVHPSGVPGYDDAARRAILRTDPFPRRDDGTVPRSLNLRMRPVVQ